jgi:hypothetical protein
VVIGAGACNDGLAPWPFLRGPSFIGSTAAGVVIGVNLAGIVARRDNNGLAPWPFLHRQHSRGRGDRCGLGGVVARLDNNVAGAVIGVNLSGTVDALDSDGLER